MEQKNVLGRMLGRAAHLSRERLEARLAEFDVTPAQAHALLYLSRCGGQAPQRDLTEFLKVKPSTANGIVDRLAEKGLVERSVSGTDARRKLLTLTELGAEKQRQFRCAVRAFEGTLEAGLSPEEQEMLRRLLGKVISNLEEDRGTC